MYQGTQYAHSWGLCEGCYRAAGTLLLGCTRVPVALLQQVQG